MAGRRVLILVIILIMLSIGGQSIIAQGAAEAFTPFTGTRMFFSPISLDFGPVGIGSTSLVQTVTITNTGSVPLANFAGGAPGVPFNATQNCAGGVAPGASCQFFFTFTPLESGRYHKDSIVSTNAGNIVIELWGGEPLKLCLPVVIR
jgi:hypothetical protein